MPPVATILEIPLARTVAATIVASTLLSLAPRAADAQYFGRNKVQYESFDFYVMESPHFDFHFYPPEAEAVEDAARMGERWYERFARTFQHEFEQSKPVILYADHADFQQTNTLQGFIGEGTGGVTESLKNRVIMPLTGSYSDTDHVLGHELVHAFQYNIAQSRAGGGLQGLSRLPLWLIEGMAEYMSVGREDPLTAMWLRDAVRRDDFPTLEQMTREARFFPYRFGQAFWAYVGGTYGDDAVVQIFRRSLRTGFQPALEQVLGMTADTLSVKWREAVEETYLPLIEGRTPPGEVGTLILAPETGSGRQNVSPALSPDGRYVAFLSEKDVFSVDLYLADARTGEVIRKLSSAAADPHFDALRFIDSSGAWSPDGSRFAFVVFAEGDNAIVVVDVSDGDVERRYEVDDVGAITSPSWSPDGSRLVFSGMEGGWSDLYLLELESGVVTQLTDDRHSDLQPTWSPDGSLIAFSSDRGPRTDFESLVFGKPQISLMDVSSGEIRTVPVFEDVKHINPQFAPDGESLYFISDQDGFSDVYRLGLEDGDVQRITRVATGVSGITATSPAMSVASETGTLVFSVFDEFEFHIYTLQASPAGTRVDVAEAPVPGRRLPPVEPEVFSRVASYLDDAATGLVPPETFSTASAEKFESDLSLDYIGQPTIGVAADRYGNYIGGGAAAYFSDMLGNRTLGVAVQAQGTFKDIGGQFFYQNRAKRWNWGVAGGRIPYLIARQFVGFDEGRELPYVGQLRERIFLDSATGLLAYPFSTTRRFEANVGVTRYSFDREIERFFLDPSGRFFTGERDTEDLEAFDPLNLVQASAAIVGDYSFFGFTSPVRGGRYRFEVESTIGSVDYFTLIADYRRYFNPITSLTVAARGLHYGRYGSEIESNEIIQPLFIGFETFVRGYAYESFEAGECRTSQAEGPTGCGALDRLFGHRLAVASMEVRVPLIGTEQYGLINLPYIPVDLVAFTDAGLAWDGSEGREAVLEITREYSGEGHVPVFSSGVSARFNILGFLILEAYYAYPWQRPDKGWHWGFQLSPGW